MEIPHSSPDQPRPASKPTKPKGKPKTAQTKPKGLAPYKQVPIALDAIQLAASVPAEVALDINARIAARAAQLAEQALDKLETLLHGDNDGCAVSAARAILACHVALNKPIAPKAPKSLQVNVDQRNQILATAEVPPAAQLPEPRAQPMTEWGFRHAAPVVSAPPACPVLQPALEGSAKPAHGAAPEASDDDGPTATGLDAPAPLRTRNP